MNDPSTFSKILSGGLYGLLAENYDLGGVALLAWMIIPLIISAVGGYLLGSLNSAVIVSRALYHDDVRKHGSKNAGMTNMFRTYGKKAGILTLCGDLLKTVIALSLGYLWLGYRGAYIAALFCMLGHMFPIYYKFRGGKGVLVVATAILMTEPIVFVVLLAIFAIVLLGTRMVSLASIMAALIYPLILNGQYAAFLGDGSTAGMRAPVAVFMTVMVVWMHRSNLKRIYEGKESKVRFPWNHDDGAPVASRSLSDADECEEEDGADIDADDKGRSDVAKERTVKKHSNYGKKKK